MTKHSEDQIVRGISPLTGKPTNFVFDGTQEGFMDIPGFDLWTADGGKGGTHTVDTIVEAQFEAQFPDE